MNPFQFASHFLSNYIRQHFGAKIPKDSSLYLLMMTGSPLAIQTKTSHKNQAENHSTSFIFKQKKTSTRNDSPYDLHEPHPFLSNCFIHPQRCPWSQEDTREHSVPMEIVTSPSPSSLETSEVKIFCAYVWWKKMVKLWWNPEDLPSREVPHPTNGKGDSSSQLSLDESMFSFWDGTRLGTNISTSLKACWVENAPRIRVI